MSIKLRQRRDAKQAKHDGRMATLGKPLRVKRNGIKTGEMVMDPARRELPPAIHSGDSSFFKVKPFVIVESPYAGDVERNARYARAAIRDCILRGEAPFASHLLYTQPGVLRDEVHEERELGMGLGWHVMRRANYITVYADLGFSSGMVRGVLAAIKAGVPARLRSLKEWQGQVPSGNQVPLEVMSYLRVEE